MRGTTPSLSSFSSSPLPIPTLCPSALPRLTSPREGRGGEGGRDGSGGEGGRDGRGGERGRDGRGGEGYILYVLM